MVTKINEACDLVIFGAKGDLTRRKLLPALYQLEKNNQLHENTRIIGVGRANWNKFFFHSIVKESLSVFMKDKINNFYLKKLCTRLFFCNLDVNHIENFIKLKNILNQKNNIIISYFAVPPSIFGAICRGLGAIQLNTPPTRIVIEKPLGTCFKTSQEINNQVSKYFKEYQIFRIDHYLGKETILNLLTLRFANTLFFNNWDNKIIDHVQITIAEKVGIEGRWGYFDQSGQIRDMVQNHLLQILSIVAMSPPKNLNTNSIRKEKIKILRALRHINPINFNKNIILGQYSSGQLNGISVPSYINEDNANNNSNTETFVAMKVNIDNHRWSGVPFYLRTGKRLPIKCSEIVISFKKPIMNLFNDNNKRLSSNKLIITLQPNEGITLQILNKVPSLNSEHILNNIDLNFKYSDTLDKNSLSDAYERLLLESMKGIQTLFVSREEVEESWKWIDTIIHTWDKKQKSPKLYTAGTWGPHESKKIIQQDGRIWHNINY
ncbi:glucose-6-phosphate dehydrogenase [Buchnera aphidicola]|uniref:glucose-6-phosphate dehydrogenase n=1 Tax=Buchnera aphidicola TaxID=9 RepID=UPI00346407C7